MINLQRRFSFPFESSPGVTGAAVPPSLAPTPNSQSSSLAMLAQLYAMAYEQARVTLQRRQFEELLELLFNTPA